jgi:hypothetical protein
MFKGTICIAFKNLFLVPPSAPRKQNVSSSRKRAEITVQKSERLYRKHFDVQPFALARMIRDELGLWLKLGIGPVAVFAVLGGGFVEQHLLPFHIAKEFVAAGTTDVLVRTGQSKLGALVMIEK